MRRKRGKTTFAELIKEKIPKQNTSKKKETRIKLGEKWKWKCAKKWKAGKVEWNLLQIIKAVKKREEKREWNTRWNKDLKSSVWKKKVKKNGKRNSKENEEGKEKEKETCCKKKQTKETKKEYKGRRLTKVNWKESKEKQMWDERKGLNDILNKNPPTTAKTSRKVLEKYIKNVNDKERRRKKRETMNKRNYTLTRNSRKTWYVGKKKKRKKNEISKIIKTKS